MDRDAAFKRAYNDRQKSTERIALKKGEKHDGTYTPKPAQELSLYLDGANIDLKGFTQGFYSKIAEGDLDTVRNTIKTLKKIVESSTINMCINDLAIVLIRTFKGSFQIEI